jgi:hypothetical protein
MPTPTIPRALALAAPMLAACILRPVPGDSTGSTTDLPSTSISTTTDHPLTTTTSTPTTTGTTDPLTSSTSTGETTTSFIIKPDVTQPMQECNGLKQLDPECRPGQKCTIDNDLGATHCVDIVSDPKGLYEPCTMQGDALSGLDDCDLGMLCWDIGERGQGICHGLCDGDSDQACICVDPWARPAFCQECAVGICFPNCDPLLQDCVGDDICIPFSNGTADFTCVLDASGDEGQANDPCEFANACDQGLVCLPTAEASSACAQDSQSCCQPFCETTQMSPCPNPDQACVPWFPPMSETPPGLENLGICKLPP